MHNLFHQSKHGPDVELQNTHIVFVMSPHNVMQFSRLGVQLGRESELVDLYRDAKSLRYGYLLIGLSPCAVDRLRYCTNTESIPSKFVYPGLNKTIKFFRQ